MPTATPRRMIWLMLAVAWVLRVGAVLTVQYYLQHVAQPPRQYVIEGDADGYWQLAHHIVSGQPYQIYTPPRAVMRMPGFPAILAGSIWLFGESLLAARLVLASLGAVGCLGVYGLGARLVNVRVGLIAGWLAALSPIFVGFSAIELTETAFAVVMVFGLVPMVKASPSSTQAAADGKEGPGPWICRGLLAGVLAAMGVYLRPSWLLFPPLLAMWLCVFRDKDQRRVTNDSSSPQLSTLNPQPNNTTALTPPRSPRFLFALTLMVGLFATLLPWGLRNQRVTGHFVMTSLWMGPSLYDGWNPQATGDSNMTFFDQENVLGRMSEYEMDRHYRDRAWQFVRQNPGRVAQLAWIKTLRYWNPFPNASQFQSWPLKLMSLAWYLVVFIPAIIGTWQCRRQLGLLAICGGPIMYFAALHLCFVSSVRYRLPGEYALLVLSAVGWEFIWKWTNHGCFILRSQRNSYCHVDSPKSRPDGSECPVTQAVNSSDISCHLNASSCLNNPHRVPYFDHQPSDCPDENAVIRIERIYCFDWNQFTDTDWTNLSNVYEQLPSWKGFGNSGPGKGCPYWFAEDEHGDSFLTASVEPPGLQVFGFLNCERWNNWNRIFLLLTEELPQRNLQ